MKALFACLSACRPYLSDQEEAMLHQPYIPNVWKELPIEAMAAAQARQQSPHSARKKGHKKWHATVPLEPFDFEKREKQKPKPIVQVLGIREQEV
jgi:hypothetical protein